MPPGTVCMDHVITGQVISTSNGDVTSVWSYQVLLHCLPTRIDDRLGACTLWTDQNVNSLQLKKEEFNDFFLLFNNCADLTSRASLDAWFCFMWVGLCHSSTLVFDYKRGIWLCHKIVFFSVRGITCKMAGPRQEKGKPFLFTFAILQEGLGRSGSRYEWINSYYCSFKIFFRFWLAEILWLILSYSS